MLVLLIPLAIFSQRFGVTEVNPAVQPESILPAALDEQDQTQQVTLELPINDSTFMIGPSDKFSISIEAGETTTFIGVVTPGGSLLIPKVGNIELFGKTLREAKLSIRDRIQANYRQSRVTIDLIGIREFSVPVTGAVSEPGFYVSTPVMRVSTIISMASPNSLADITQVRITDKMGKEQIVNISEFFSAGNLSDNPTLNDGDQIHIPHSDISNSVVVVRGAVQDGGYLSILPNETLASLVSRKIEFKKDADLENVKIIRSGKEGLQFITVKPSEFNSFVLLGRDEIEFLFEQPINVLGFVAAPGSYQFIPGYTSSDYINLAGGILPAGATKGVKIIRKNGDILRGSDVIIQRGDIIEVRRSTINILVGEISILQFASTLATLALAYSAVN
jgi:protein involved in polysaccharide export with SLBB domain